MAETGNRDASLFQGPKAGIPPEGARGELCRGLRPGGPPPKARRYQRRPLIEVDGYGGAKDGMPGASQQRPYFLVANVRFFEKNGRTWFSRRSWIPLIWVPS